MREYSTPPSTPRVRTPAGTRPTLTSRRSSSPTVTQALRGLGQGGATRSQILRGPLADGFADSSPRTGTETKTATNTTTATTTTTRWSGLGAGWQQTPRAAGGERERAEERGRQMQRPAVSEKPSARNDHIAVATAAADDDDDEVQKDDNLDKLVHTVTTQHQQPEEGGYYPPHRAQRSGLPSFAQGVPSRGIFSKTRGHYEYADDDKAHMLPVSKPTLLPPQRAFKDTKMSDTSREAKEERAEELERRGTVLNGDRTSFADADAGVAAPLTKRQKVLRHFKKWWWAHLLVLICIVVLSVCLIIFVGIPRIAQARVNKAILSIQGITLSQTQATNITLAINSTIQADDSIHAVIDPFPGVMYLEDWPPQTPFARIQFPSVTSATKSVVNITQFTEILDMNAFTVFNDWFIQNASLRVSVEGDSRLKVNGINKKYPIHFKKTIEIPALSNLNGTTVPNSTVLLVPDDLGNNFVGTAVIPNRSFIQFELGNVTFTNYMINANGSVEEAGQIFIDNLTISPGNHSYPLRGTVPQTPVLQQIQYRPYCVTGNIPFLLQGQNVTNHGQYLSYFADSLATTNQSVSIPIRTDLEALGLTINCLD